MALSTADKALLGIADRLAYQQVAGSTAMNGGTDLWDRGDAAANEVLENRINGSLATLADAELLDPPLANLPRLQEFIATLSQYAMLDLGYASFDSYLTARMFRVDQRFAALLRSRGLTLTPANVHAPADAGVAAPGLNLGNFLKGSAFVDGSDISALLCGPSALMVRPTVLGTADWTLTVTALLADATTKALTQVITGTTGGGAVGNAYVLGKQALSSGAAAGQKVIPVAATAQFLAGQSVLITEWTGAAPDEVWSQQEVGIIVSVQTNTSITVTTNLLHTYTAAAFVYPCFTGITACTDSGGTAANRAYFYPAADRRLKL